MTYYFHIFFESLWTASIVPLASEPTFFALKAFGQSMAIPFVLAVAGAMCGQIINWIIGIMLLRLQRQGRMHISPEKYEHSRERFHRYLLFMLVFSWLPLLNILTAASGFFGARLRLVLPLVFIGEAAHYGYYLL